VTPADDYPGAMPPLPQVDDATVERLLAGRADTPDLEPVATAVRALREVSRRPVEPSATLRRQMTAGVFTGTSAYAYRPAGRGPVRRIAAAAATSAGRLRLAMRVAAALVAAAVLGTGTAGFAGTLPEPVQDRFETVVESVTPYQFAEKTGGGTGPASKSENTEPGDRRGGVSEDANDGGVEGPEVSEDARERERERERGRPTDLPTPAQEAPGQQRRPTSPPGQRN
jgi:hypothetical protein